MSDGQVLEFSGLTKLFGSAGAAGPQWWAGGLVLLAYALVLLALGHLLSWRRDVS